MTTRKRMTNAEFGRRVGCDQSMASLLRRGLRLPGTDLFLEIVHEFGLDANEAGQAYRNGMDAYGAYLRASVFGNGPVEPGEQSEETDERPGQPYEPEE